MKKYLTINFSESIKKLSNEEALFLFKFLLAHPALKNVTKILTLNMTLLIIWTCLIIFTSNIFFKKYSLTIQKK
jgi:hypothetical protein